MPEQLEVMSRWYDSCKNELTLVSRDSLAAMLCRIGLYTEKDSAMKLLFNRLRPEIFQSEHIGWIDFAKCFISTMFKEALLDKLKSIEES